MKKNIYQKLLEIQKHVDAFVKDSKSYGYTYVSGNQVLNKIRPLMNEYGLLLKQEIVEITNTRIDYNTRNGEKSEILTKTSQRFTWIDTETGEKDENMFGANGMNEFEKGLGSALTYAERYFLLKYFHVPTDSEDPDNPKRKENKQADEFPVVWMSDEIFKKIKEMPKEKIAEYIKFYSGSIKEGKKYLMKKSFKQELEKLAK